MSTLYKDEPNRRLKFRRKRRGVAVTPIKKGQSPKCQNLCQKRAKFAINVTLTPLEGVGTLPQQKGGSGLELLDRVVGTLIRNVIVPVVAKTGQMDQAVKSLKRAAVELLITETDASKTTIADHFGKSNRWAYRMLEEAKEIKEGIVKEEPRPLLYDVMDLLYVDATQGYRR